MTIYPAQTDLIIVTIKTAEIKDLEGITQLIKPDLTLPIY